MYWYTQEVSSMKTTPTYATDIDWKTTVSYTRAGLEFQLHKIILNFWSQSFMHWGEFLLQMLLTFREFQFGGWRMSELNSLTLHIFLKVEQLKKMIWQF